MTAKRFDERSNEAVRDTFGTKRQRAKDEETSSIVAGMDERPFVLRPVPRRPLAEITGLDIPRGIDRDELILEFKTPEE